MKEEKADKSVVVCLLPTAFRLLPFFIPYTLNCPASSSSLT
jgi:hypothetical protein